MATTAIWAVKEIFKIRTVKQEISNADYASFMKKFDFLKDISPVKIAYDIISFC